MHPSLENKIWWSKWEKNSTNIVLVQKNHQISRTNNSYLALVPKSLLQTLKIITMNNLWINWLKRFSKKSEELIYWIVPLCWIVARVSKLLLRVLLSKGILGYVLTLGTWATKLDKRPRRSWGPWRSKRLIGTQRLMESSRHLKIMSRMRRLWSETSTIPLLLNKFWTKK